MTNLLTGTRSLVPEPEAHPLAELLPDWPEPAVLASDDGVVLALNRAAVDLLGTAAEDSVGRLLAAIIGVDATRALLAGEGDVELPPGGNRTALVLRARPTREGGSLVLVRRRSADPARTSDLEQAERLASIGELLSSVAHELNNPLTSVLGYTELLLAEDDENLPRDELERVHSEATRCRRIVENLLDLSRAERFESRPVHLPAVVSKVVEFRVYATTVSSIELVAEVDDECPLVLGDFHRLVQAILNLVTNAEHAVADRPEGKRIVVRARAAAEHVVVEVEDNGPGVPADLAQAVFEPFFTTKPRGRGTGLGLSLVRSTARAHGGDVRVVPGRDGGACFVVEIPIALEG